jgi:hypothetical protein
VPHPLGNEDDDESGDEQDGWNRIREIYAIALLQRVHTLEEAAEGFCTGTMGSGSFGICYPDSSERSSSTETFCL